MDRPEGKRERAEAAKAREIPMEHKDLEEGARQEEGAMPASHPPKGRPKETKAINQLGLSRFRSFWRFRASLGVGRGVDRGAVVDDDGLIDGAGLPPGGGLGRHAQRVRPAAYITGIPG